MTRAPRATALALGIVALALYSARLEHTPAYLHDAEILFGLQAHAIATTAHDLSGRLLPLYFQMQPIGDNVWFHPAIVYVTAAFLKVLPFAEWSVRFPSSAVGALDVVLIYFVALRMFGRQRPALAAALLLLLTPAHFIHSRIAMDYIYPLPFVLGWLLAIAWFVERRRPWMLFVATSILGLGVYSYIASVVMMPIYLAMTLVVVWKTAPRRLIAPAILGFAWPLVAIPLWLWSHPLVVAETLSRYHLGTTPNRYAGLAGRLSMFWYFHDPTYLFLAGGYANVVNSTRHVGVFALPLAILLPAGIYRIARGPREIMPLVVLAGFFSAPVAACLAVPEPYAIDRELSVVVFGVLLAVIGLEFLWHSREMARRVAIGATALVPLHFAFFVYDYFTDYRQRSAIWFELNHRGALEALLDRESQAPSARIYLPRDKDPYMASYWRFTLATHGRPELESKTELYTAAQLAPASIPARSLVVARLSEPVPATLMSAGLRTVATIPEVGDPPEFIVLER